jgi:uncharacterized protein with HEPN domain
LRNAHRSDSWDPKRVRQRLEDILCYGTSIRTLLGGLTFENFLENETIQKAACFDLLCISEATSHLLNLDPEIEERHPNIPWRQIRAIANVLRHAYGRIDLTVVWDTVVKGDTIHLLAAIENELSA